MGPLSPMVPSPRAPGLPGAPCGPAGPVTTPDSPLGPAGPAIPGGPGGPIVPRQYPVNIARTRSPPTMSKAISTHSTKLGWRCVGPVPPAGTSAPFFIGVGWRRAGRGVVIYVGTPCQPDRGCSSPSLAFATNGGTRVREQLKQRHPSQSWHNAPPQVVHPLRIKLLNQPRPRRSCISSVDDDTTLILVWSLFPRAVFRFCPSDRLLRSRMRLEAAPAGHREFGTSSSGPSRIWKRTLSGAPRRRRRSNVSRPLLSTAPLVPGGGTSPRPPRCSSGKVERRSWW